MEVYNEVARVLNKKVKKGVDNSLMDKSIELGVITNSGLKLDNFKHIINEYSQLHYLKQENNKLVVGDRVLVSAIGNEFIVVGRIVNA